MAWQPAHNGGLHDMRPTCLRLRYEPWLVQHGFALLRDMQSLDDPLLGARAHCAFVLLQRCRNVGQVLLLRSVLLLG